MKGIFLDLRKWYDSLDWYQGRLVVAGVVCVFGLAIAFWQIMIPVLVLAVGVVLFLRYRYRGV